MKKAKKNIKSVARALNLVAVARIDGRCSVLPAVARRQPLTKTQGMRTVQDDDDDCV